MELVAVIPDIWNACTSYNAQNCNKVLVCNHNDNFAFRPLANRRQVQRGLSSSSSDALLILFAMYPERSAILPWFLHRITPHSLPFTVTCQHRPQNFAQNSAVCKTHIQQYPLSRVGQLQKHIEFFIPVHRMFLLFNYRRTLWPKSPKLNHTE